MLNKLKELHENFKLRIVNVKTNDELQQIKSEYTGKNSPLNDVLKEMRHLGPAEKKEIGQISNDIKSEIISKINELSEKFQKELLLEQLKKDKIDITLPGLKLKPGTKHPLNLVIDEISDIFTELGYEMINGTEFETDEYCFQKLNLPVGHPARDMQDTFYITKDTLLRTHATNMTARMLMKISSKKSSEQNVAGISYGNVYRRDDDDATHSHQFMQIDGFALGDKISFANLKWILEYMCKRLFTTETEIRMRPSFFPFTEPSVEVDVTCISCAGKGCRICKQTGYIEILGAGMIDPKVLELNEIDPNLKTGLAFGIGIERIAMLKFGVKNIRDFYENDIRFLDQFKFFGD